ncbi:MAG: hypothetical protein SCALA702_31060 [Melioribacteraceae bacterium]|nr:MAG: hypothetical protein SCALA702_31060 [Melioribacteraceae bacterium]
MKKIRIASQPDDVTCGPTSLHAVYDYYDDSVSLTEVINSITYLEEGGTLGVHLGIHALKRGYTANIYTYNLQLFDPTWFHNPSGQRLLEFLSLQKKVKPQKKLVKATNAYIEFLKLGGTVNFKELSPQLLKGFFDKQVPVLTGLNATYLYNTSREFVEEDGRISYDNLRGTSSGHFVVLGGYDEVRKRIIVADPYSDNPLTRGKYYAVNVHRLLNSIMLGIITYDANLLIIHPGK